MSLIAKKKDQIRQQIRKQQLMARFAEIREEIRTEEKEEEYWDEYLDVVILEEEMERLDLSKHCEAYQREQQEFQEFLKGSASAQGQESQPENQQKSENQ